HAANELQNHAEAAAARFVDETLESELAARSERHAGVVLQRHPNPAIVAGLQAVGLEHDLSGLSGNRRALAHHVGSAGRHLDASDAGWLLRENRSRSGEQGQRDGERQSKSAHTSLPPGFENLENRSLTYKTGTGNARVRQECPHLGTAGRLCTGRAGWRVA